MDKLKKQLQLSTIVEEQKQQIAKLDQKYKDLAKAYRILQDEKQGHLGTEGKSPSSSASESVGNGILHEKLKQTQVERSRLEAAFQQERNKLIDEKEELEKSLDEALKSFDTNSLKYRAHIKELRNRLSFEASQTEQERGNNQVLLKELQKALSEERQKKEILEVELARYRAQAGVPKETERDVRYKEAILEIESLRRKLVSTEALVKEKSQRLQKAGNDLRQVSTELEKQLEVERLKATKVEENLRQLTQLQEMRVSSHEAKISELTDTLCSYENLRMQDAALIASLREKVAKLEDMPKSLKKPESERLKDVNSIMNQMIKLKSELYMVNDRAEMHVDIDAFLRSQFGAYADHTLCEKEEEYIRQELIQLKLRFQETAVAKHDNVLLEEVTLLSGKVNMLQSEIEVLSFEKNRAMSDLKAAQILCAEQVDLLSNENKQLTVQAETKLQESRERLLKVIAEKDDEIASLKGILNAPVGLRRARSPSHATAADEITQSLSQITVANATTPAGAKILHFVEDMSRKDVEISSLRKSKFELERCLRETETDYERRETMLLEQLQGLKSQIRQQDSAEARETANLEYVKNVMLRYLLTSDKQIQCHLFNALSTILCFTSDELKQVRKKHPYWK